MIAYHFPRLNAGDTFERLVDVSGYAVAVNYPYAVIHGVQDSLHFPVIQAERQFLQQIIQKKTRGVRMRGFGAALSAG